MGKREDFVVQLRPLLTDGGLPAELEAFLVSHSNLPGPRGNLELAAAFADAVETAADASVPWDLLLRWAEIPALDAPTGDPREFLPFCALQALGALYTGSVGSARERIVEILKTSASDARWRTREGVAMGFQRIGERDFPSIRAVFSDWVAGASPMEQRAIVAALAHPPMLKDPHHVRFCLSISEQILEGVVHSERDARKDESFRILREGLEYALSVFVVPLPDDGFALLRRWTRSGDSDVSRIIRSNLGKARLAKKFPDRVEEVLVLLESGR